MGKYLQQAYPDEYIPSMSAGLLSSTYGQVMENATSVTFSRKNALTLDGLVSVSIDDSNSGGVLLYYDPLLLEDPSADGVRTDVYIALTTGHSKIVAPENSYRLFAFENLSQINFNGMLDTS